MDVYDQVIQLFTAKHRFIKEVNIEDIQDYEEKLLAHIHSLHKYVIDDMRQNKRITEENETKLKEIVKEFTKDYVEK
jgi:F-type H+-transporting ATPase subunit alpha